MNPKRSTIETGIEALRAEMPEAQAQHRALLALRSKGTPRLRTARTVWVAAFGLSALAIVALPLALRTQASRSYGLSLTEAIEASKSAPAMQMRIFIKRNGKVRLWSEDWFSGKRSAHRMADPTFTYSDLRKSDTVMYSHRRNPEYEIISKVSLTPPTEQPMADIYTLDTLLGQNGPGNGKAKIVQSSESEREGRKVRRYKVQLPGQTGLVVETEASSNRVVRIEHADGGYTTIDYPASASASVFDPPAPSGLKRFYLEDERKAVAHQIATGVGTRTVDGAAVQLLAAFQDPAHRLIVVFRSGKPGDTSQPPVKVGKTFVPVLLSGLRNDNLHIAHESMPRALKFADIDVPIRVAEGNGVRYATFRKVSIRQTLPIEHIYMSLEGKTQ